MLKVATLSAHGRPSGFQAACVCWRNDIEGFIVCLLLAGKAFDTAVMCKWLLFVVLGAPTNSDCAARLATYSNFFVPCKFCAQEVQYIVSLTLTM